jgi:hypothetical protein
MKNQADAHTSEREFQVGDLVYLKLQPHIQTSGAPRSNHKLSFRFYGPFPILQKVGAGAYKLQLPADAKIHPVVHVSQLKRHIPTTEQVTTDLSSVSVDPLSPALPVAIMDQAYKSIGSSTALRLLVQWDTPSNLLTWEDEQDQQRRFPEAPSWGQATSKVEKNVVN